MLVEPGRSAGWSGPAKPSAEKGDHLRVRRADRSARAWMQFDLRFYVVALLFVIFDVEMAFFFPWAVVFGKANELADERDAGRDAGGDGGPAGRTPSRGGTGAGSRPPRTGRRRRRWPGSRSPTSWSSSACCWSASPTCGGAATWSGCAARRRKHEASPGARRCTGGRVEV